MPRSATARCKPEEGVALIDICEADERGRWFGNTMRVLDESAVTGCILFDSANLQIKCVRLESCEVRTTR